MVFLTIIIVAISERERMSALFKLQALQKITTWLPVIFLATCFAIESSSIVAFAIIGFWAAWKLKWWGGADAMMAIVLILIYPQLSLIISLLVVHVLVVIVLVIWSLIEEKSIKLLKVPGLPLLFLAVLSFMIIHICFYPGY